MTIFDTHSALERKIWTPFQYSMRFTTIQRVERVIIFGLYSGAYLHGQRYLTAYQDFELALLLAQYNSKVSELDSDRQQALLDIASKRYLTDIETLIHTRTLNLKREEITIQDSEWDAKFTALEADRAAIQTMITKIATERKNIQARIKTLLAQIKEEESAFALVDLDVAKREMDIEYAEIKLSQKDIELAQKDIEISEKDIEVSQKDLSLTAKEIEIVRKANDKLKLELDIEESSLQKISVSKDILKIQLQVIEAGLKLLATEIEAAQYKEKEAGLRSDIAKTAQVRLDLVQAELEKDSLSIDLAGKDIQIADVETDVKKIESQKIEVPLEYINVDRDVAGIERTIVGIELEAIENTLLEAQLETETAQYDGDVSKLVLYEKKVEMINAETDLVDSEKENVESAIDSYADLHVSELNNLVAKNQFKIDELNQRKDDALAGYQERADNSTMDLELAEEKREPTSQLTALGIETTETETYYIKEIDKELVKSMEALMAAEITTNLLHAVGKE